MEARMKYPVGIQHFPKLIENGYVYVDKTRYIRKLVAEGEYYFLSRPRRFGKSLFISTLQAFFEGRRDLFKGLYIDTDDIDWTPRPVIKISLNTVDPKSVDTLYQSLDNTFAFYENQYGRDTKESALSDRFTNLLRNAYMKTGKKIAILVDEYDAPLLDTIDNEDLNQAYRETLKSIFSVLKSSDEYIHFAFITGVSRFSHTSLFSGANNLEDISFRNEYAAICGITEEELHETLMPGIHDFAEKMNISAETVLEMLKENYDGYHFSGKCPDIYNPFSLLQALKTKEIDNYWFKSGTPTYLMKVLKRDNFYLPQLDCIESVMSELSANDSFMSNPIALLFEAGYITIKSYDSDIEMFTLGLPNKEVATSFTEALLPIYSDMSQLDCRDSFINMRKAIFRGEPDNFMRHLQTFLQGNQYSNTELAKREKYFKNNIYLIFKALGFFPRVEEETCNSRMDVFLRTRQFIYIFELKTDHTSEEGIRQIKDKGYVLPYVDEGRRLIKISANYSGKDNNIDSWIIDMD